MFGPTQTKHKHKIPNIFFNSDLQHFTSHLIYRKNSLHEHTNWSSHPTPTRIGWLFSWHSSSETHTHTINTSKHSSSFGCMCGAWMCSCSRVYGSHIFRCIQISCMHTQNVPAMRAGKNDSWPTHAHDEIEQKENRTAINLLTQTRIPVSVPFFADAAISKCVELCSAIISTSTFDALHLVETTLIETSKDSAAGESCYRFKNNLLHAFIPLHLNTSSSTIINNNSCIHLNIAPHHHRLLIFIVENL